jgi:hypothetical protein
MHFAAHVDLFTEMLPACTGTDNSRGVIEAGRFAMRFGYFEAEGLGAIEVEWTMFDGEEPR